MFLEFKEMQEDKDKEDMEQTQISPQETSLDESKIPEAPQDESSLEDKVDGPIDTEIDSKAKDDKSWYIVQAYSGFEKQVASAIKENAKMTDMSEKFGDVIVPAQKILEVRRGKKVNLERNFFPGYVLVKMNMSNEAYHLVNNVNKVTGFLGGVKGSPTPVSEDEINSILKRAEDDELNPKLKVKFDVGEQVRVSDGPFASFNGLVEEVDEERSRLKVSVSIFGRATPVELEFSQVEKI